MKQKDIALIAAVVIFSAVLSILVARFVFAKPSNQKQKAEVVQPISADFAQPDEKYFNKESVNATEPIRIGDNSNPDPFREAAKP